MSNDENAADHELYRNGRSIHISEWTKQDAVNAYFEVLRERNDAREALAKLRKEHDVLTELAHRVVCMEEP